MYENLTVGAVVTAYNEEGLVGDVIEEMPAFVDRVYVVDDGSSDGTWPEIQRYASRLNDDSRGSPPVTTAGVQLSPRVVPLRHESNAGVGAAMKTGYRQALEDGVDLVASLDGDGQMPQEELHRLIEPVARGQADYAKGNRLWNRRSRRGMSRWRLFGNSLLSLLTKASSGYWGMADPQNGYTVISRDALDTIPIDRLTDGYGFLNDLLVLLNVYDVRIADVSHRAKYGDEQSHIRYATFVPRLSSLLLRNFVWRLKTNYLVFDFHPIVFCYGLGLVGFGGSLLMGAAALAASGPTATFVAGGISFLAFLVAGLLVLLGLTLDVERNAELVVRVHEPATSGRPGEIPPGHPAVVAGQSGRDQAEQPPVVSRDGGSRDVTVDRLGSDD